MQMREWLAQNHPDEGPMWLVRNAETSYQTAKKVLDGVPLASKKTAMRLSEATGGSVSVAELMDIALPSSPRSAV
jgi:hypothetical protein